MAVASITNSEALSMTEQGSTTAASTNINVGDDPSPEDILRKPWKFVGYKRYAEFIASDHDFRIFRRFDVLNARIALFLQDEISALEEDLAELDRACSRVGAPDVNNGTFRDDQVENRISLLETISDKLYHYNKFMLQQASLGKYPDAPPRDVRSVRNWHHNHDFSAIAAKEQKYLDQDDIFCVLQKDKTPLRRAIDGSYRFRTMKIWKRSGDNVPEYDAPNVTYYSDKRIDHFASLVIVVIGMCLLIIPLWILQGLSSLRIKLGVITAFIFTFLLILSFAMVSKPFEALAATAAYVNRPVVRSVRELSADTSSSSYAAILMVFIQLGS
ncbi:hypothetical protein F66182_1087 [Fusarium sp. NRRL 66182]|nr:hypothetical protein F66182_1087 [Fusarium sp. NRRL 66182]